MRQLSNLSGTWRGWIITNRNRDSVAFELRFGNASIIGEGIDSGGRFEIDGQFDAVSSRVVFTKRYANREVLQEARWDGRILAGRWFFSCLNMSEEGPVAEAGSGSFELWPAGDEIPLPPIEET